jgi:hypothetical protein
MTDYRMKNDMRTKYGIIEPGLEAGIYVKRERKLYENEVWDN